MSVCNYSHEVFLSVGIATCPEYGMNANGLLCVVDKAFYKDKQDRRNRVIMDLTKFIFG